MKNKTLEQVKRSISDGQTCVINLTATWCSDCTDQSKNLALFSDALEAKQVACYALVVQTEKNVYLTPEHENFTELLGGRGFPRTVLVIEGKVVDANNVEVISLEQLNTLLQTFLQQL